MRGEPPLTFEGIQEALREEAAAEYSISTPSSCENITTVHGVPVVLPE